MGPDHRRAKWSWENERLKDDVEDFQLSLDRHGLTGMHHWASVEDLLSILLYGIRSPIELGRLGIAYVPRGYGSPEKEAVLSRYCHLMVLPYLGLVVQRGLAQSALLEVEPAAAWIVGALYVPGNSARASMRLNDIAARSRLEDFEALFPTPDSPHPSDYQAEILVPESISPHFIKRVICSDRTIADRIRNLCAERLTEMPYPPTIEASLDFGHLA